MQRLQRQRPPHNGACRVRHGLLLPVKKLLRACGALVALAAAAAACAGKEVPPPPAEPAPPAVMSPAPAAGAPQTAEVFHRETGIATWYGKELHGKKTANGEVFDMNALTAAHRTLPFGTHIRVVNLENFKSIKAIVTDRGPFVPNRVLELSYGAARELGFVNQGVARVKLETVEPVRDPAVYTVLAANYIEEDSAKALKARLKRFEPVTIEPFETNKVRYYRVRVGSFASEERAEQTAGKLRLEGLEPLVMRKD